MSIPILQEAVRVKLIHKIKVPCPKCPYKLGLVQMTTNPCPQCRENRYQTYERFQQRLFDTIGEIYV